MVFGVFIDVPLLRLTFVAMFRFRKRLTSVLAKVRVPPLAMYLLIVRPADYLRGTDRLHAVLVWCGNVLVPPTLPFLLAEMFVLGVLVLRLHARSLLRVTLVFSVYGVLFEILVGGLMGGPIIVVALLAPYVALGYAFISMLPLNVLIQGKGMGEKSGGPIPDMGG